MPAVGERAPQFFTIPAGTRSRPCTTCDEPIFMVMQPSGKYLPVSCDWDGAYEPTARESGEGISHFVTCPGRDVHRRR